MGRVNTTSFLREAKLSLESYLKNATQLSRVRPLLSLISISLTFPAPFVLIDARPAAPPTSTSPPFSDKTHLPFLQRTEHSELNLTETWKEISIKLWPRLASAGLGVAFEEVKSKVGEVFKLRTAYQTQSVASVLRPGRVSYQFFLLFF